MPDPNLSISPQGSRKSTAMIGLGILVVALGFGLPRLFTGTSTPIGEPTASRSSSASPRPVPATDFEPTPSQPELLPALARAIGGLVLVCASCIGISYWLAQRKPIVPGTMEIVASLPIDPRCAVHLVRAGKRRLLLGIDPSGVKALAELPGRPSDRTAELAPERPSSEASTSPAGVSAATRVIGPVAVSVAVPPSRATEMKRSEIESILEQLRRIGSSASPPPG